MNDKWLVIGISGVTCGGKTTLSKELHKTINGSEIISQDDYFLDVNDERHTWISELNHINYDILSSLDMPKMHSDIKQILGSKKKHSVPNDSDVNGELKGTNILIVEGFSIFNYRPIEQLCDLKYYFTLSREECFKRRILRVYDPPDCAGYFEVCVWPEYQKQLKEVRETVKNVTFFNGAAAKPIKSLLNDVVNFV